MKSLRIWGVALLGVVLVVAPVWGLAEKVATMPAPAGYIDDYAGVLTDDGKSELESLCREVHNKTKAQVFFVTVKTLDGEAVETFANELFAKWKIGEKKTDRGVLLVLAIAEHKRWIEVGYGLEGILNDAKAGDIGREMVPELKAAKYDDAARTGVRGVSKVIAADAGVTIDGLEDADASPSDDSAVQSDTPSVGVPSSEINKGGAWAVGAFFLLAFGGFGAFVWWRVRMFRRGNPGAALFGSSGSSSDSDSGSSFGGGGSDDSFSGGDGGSSGGGGAGGDW